MLGRMQRKGTPVLCWWGCKLVELFGAQYEGSSENEARIILRFSNCPFVYTCKRIEVSMLQKYLHFHFLFTAALLTAVKNGSNLSVQHLLHGKEKCIPRIHLHTYTHMHAQTPGMLFSYKVKLSPITTRVDLGSKEADLPEVKSRVVASWTMVGFVGDMTRC